MICSLDGREALWNGYMFAKMTSWDSDDGKPLIPRLGMNSEKLVWYSSHRLIAVYKSSRLDICLVPPSRVPALDIVLGSWSLFRAKDSEASLIGPSVALL